MNEPVAAILDATIPADAADALARFAALREQARQEGERAGLLLSRALASAVTTSHPTAAVLLLAPDPVTGRMTLDVITDATGTPIPGPAPHLDDLLDALGPFLGAVRAHLALRTLTWYFPTPD